jgi:hypothetical protein
MASYKMVSGNFGQLRFVDFAIFIGILAPRMKIAAAGDVNRARDISF